MKYLSDILILIGCSAITLGAGLIAPVLALFVGGGFCVLAGIVLALSNWAGKRSAG